ncbi:MAG: N-acetylmuramoyl-L-alanine amidase [Clostridia bacterium]|nr:N-acetylmuramoyl-L-alanine amidase [Clostridia bacterium]MDY5554559.1 N-acetylmuramoyl-L-alanine amidase [Blautia sp.]
MKKNIIELVMACLLLVSFFFLSREAAKTVQEMNATDVNNVILVDAGHGGDDPGMIGVNGLEEKGINLSISEKLKKNLEKKGFKVIMTREEDKGLYEENSRNQKAQDLQNRIALISKYKPVLSVSIHQNSYSDPAVYGPQVFYYKDSVEGEKLAQALQAQLNDQLKVKRPRSPKGDRTYYLLKRSEGVLNIVECGFLTNPSEASLLQTEEYQEKVAQAVTDGICNYLDKD